jgi:hypothetical protein
MPDVDSLMQEWPTQFEELLKEVFYSLLYDKLVSSLFRHLYHPLMLMWI